MSTLDIPGSNDPSLAVTSEKQLALFADLPLPETLQATLAEHKFVNPTPIQSKSIPVILEGHDLLGTAQTGTGKTLAFALPMVAKLLEDPLARIMVLVPTRELAQQVTKTFNLLIKKHKNIRTSLLIGGEYIRQQMAELSKNPRIIIGTPGRVIDHLERKTLKAEDISYLVLDEMDRMLDMGFGLQLDEILSYLPKERQTLMFSATLPPHISKTAQRYLKNPRSVAIGQHSQPVAKIKQDVVFVKQSEKFDVLVQKLNERQEIKNSGSTIVFVKTKIDADTICDQLRDLRLRAAAMHGDLRQAKRQRVLNDFRTRKLDILVATDIAARGIDISHVELVINYELPQATEDYVHRIGRTGRGGAEGASLSLVAPFEYSKWRDILKLTSPEAAKEFAAARLDRSGHQDRGFKKSGPRRSFGGAPQRSFGEKRGSFFGENKEQHSRSSNSSFGARRDRDGERRFENKRFGDGERRFDSNRFADGERRFESNRFADGERRFESNRFQRDGERRFGGSADRRSFDRARPQQQARRAEKPAAQRRSMHVVEGKIVVS